MLHRHHSLLLLLGALCLLAALAAAAPDFSNYDKAKKQIKEIRDRCGNTLVCVNNAVKLSQSEADSLKILEDVIVKQKFDSRVSVGGVCFGVVVENKMDGDFTLDSSSEKLRISAYITYNLFRQMTLARPSAMPDCSRKIVIFYSKLDSTLYTFATEKLMTSEQIRTASAAARPYFGSSILEGMRFLVQIYIDTIVGI